VKTPTTNCIAFRVFNESTKSNKTTVENYFLYWRRFNMFFIVHQTSQQPVCSLEIILIWICAMYLMIIQMSTTLQFKEV